MNAQYTPGPWAIAPKSLGGAEQIYTEKHGRIATINNTYPDAEAEANARLIAAAPELLQACKKAYQQLRDIQIAYGAEGVEIYPDGCEMILEAAIAKADQQAIATPKKPNF